MNKINDKRSLLVAGAIVLVALAAAASVQAALRAGPVRPIPVARLLSQPLAVVTAPGDPAGRLFVVEHSGKIVVFDHGAIQQQPFLDLSATNAKVVALAFHPAYKQNRLLYVLSVGASGDRHLIEYKTDGARIQPNSGAELLMLNRNQPRLTSITASSTGTLYALSSTGTLYRLAH